MTIGFLREDVIKGGQHENLYYNHIIVPNLRPEFLNGFYAIEVDEADVTYAFLVANRLSIGWRDVGIYAELPVSAKGTPVPNYLPNNTYVDENDVEQTFTLEEYGKVRGDSLDNQKWVFKATVHADLTRNNLDNFDAAVTGLLGTGLTTYQARNLLDGPAYTAP